MADRGGDTNSPLRYLYDLWWGINARCRDPHCERWERYGGRGIRVYPLWRDDYAAFRSWILTELGERPTPNHSLDRIDNDGHYEPGNLRWSTKREQVLNRRNACLEPNVAYRKQTATWRVQRDGLTRDQAIAYRDAGELAIMETK